MMADYEYWRKQDERSLFSEVDLARPEQKRLAGRFLIIGGNKGSFFAVAHTMEQAHVFGAGEVRVLLPSSLSGKVPSAPDIYFVKAEASGAFGKEALGDVMIQADWADVIVLAGDIGKNAETSMMLTDFLKECKKPVFLMRDAVDAVAQDAESWSSRREAKTVLLLTISQLQKLLRVLYYPKVITLSMPTNQLVEALHKFTISYDFAIATFHNGQIIVAEDGEVITTDISKTTYTPITIWDGALLMKMACVSEWNKSIDCYKSLAGAIFA